MPESPDTDTEDEAPPPMDEPAEKDEGENHQASKSIGKNGLHCLVDVRPRAARGPEEGREEEEGVGPCFS